MRALYIIVAVFVQQTWCQQSGQPTPNATKPFWLENGLFQDTQTGDLPSSVDISIIGSG